MPKLKRKTIVIYILAIIVLYLIIAVIPSITDALTATETVHYGKLTVKDQVTGVVVRDETVYTAGVSGTVDFRLKEGDVITKGTRVLDIKEVDGEENNASSPSGKYSDIIASLDKDTIEDDKGISQRRGKYSHYADGYENFYTPSSMKKITASDMKNHGNDSVDLRRKEVIKGEPVYRVADNKSWYVLCWLDENSAGKYKKGNNVKLQMPDGWVKASVYDIAREGHQWKLILRSSGYCKNWEKIRVAEMSIVTADSEGLIISSKSLTTKNGQVGVYVRSTTEDYVFTPVQVLGTDGKNTMVSESAYYDKKGNSVHTVEIYDEVLKNPKKQ